MEEHSTFFPLKVYKRISNGFQGFQLPEEKKIKEKMQNPKIDDFCQLLLIFAFLLKIFFDLFSPIVSKNP